MDMAMPMPEVITLEKDGDVHPLVLVPAEGEPVRVAVRGDPPVRFFHAARSWCATGNMASPPGCPLSHEYRECDDIT